MFNHSDKYSSDETLSVDASRSVRLSSRRDFISPADSRPLYPPPRYVYIHIVLYIGLMTRATKPLPTKRGLSISFFRGGFALLQILWHRS